jgi:amino acid adenylation domain-containing protein
MQSVFEVEGELLPAAFEKAFAFMLERHESLRTVFRENINGEISQFILPAEDTGFRVAYTDFRYNPDQEQQVKELVKQEFLKPFDLTGGPLIQVSLFQLADNRWVFTYVMHHIISDGWSKNILINELFSVYNAFSKGEEPGLAPLRIQYRDYAIWEQEQLSGAALQQHKDYWLQQFAGELPVLQLPADRMRPAVKTYNGDVVRKTLNAAAVKDLRTLCDKQGATLFMGLFATVNILLHRYTGQEDIILGSLVAGREHADLEGQIGFYLATLALRTQFSETSTFREVLGIVKQVTIGAYTHQVYPFEELVDQLHLPRNMSRHPLIDVMVILQNMERTLAPGKQESANIRINGFAGRENVISKFDLLFDFAETGDTIQLKIEYNRDLYNRDTVQRMLEHLEQIVLAIAARPSLPVNRLDYLGEEEKRQLLSVFNNTEVSYPQHYTMIDRFEEQVRRSPASIALVFEGREVTYGELDHHTSQLADYLVHKGVQADTLVPVCIERGPEMIIAIMGILRAGAAYVPVDTAWPADRIAYVLEDCRATIVIGSSFGKQKMPAAPLIDFIALDSGELMGSQPAEKRRTSPAPHHLAYVIYTSGSTGKPKGVMVEHGGMLNHLLAKINDLQMDATTILAYTASYTFDISVWQMFAALLCGGKTIIYPDSLIYQPAGLLHSVDADHVTILELVPAYLSMALQETTGLPLKHLQYLLVTGEAVSRSLLEQWFEHPAYSAIPVVNAYGPTEASDDICHHKMYETPAGIHVPLGKPVQNLQIYILNNAQQLCPAGITGEICVAGIGVSRGYLNQEKLTDERFIPDPFCNGQQRRMFRTGDLGRWLPDGTIEYLGRMDDQVKIHGYRIEPGEIEGLLQECDGVARAAVSVITDNAGGKRLAGYIVPEGRFNKEGILAWLRNKLPEYMIPSALVEIDRIPLTENGKTDRNALPVPNTLEETGEVYVAPHNETEAQLAAIWQQILGKEKISIRDNFFDLGGHSLKAIQLMARINTAFLIRINIQTIFKEATIENLAEQILFIQDQNRQKKNREDLVQIEI